MDLLPTDEQDEIIATVRSQLDREFDLHALADRRRRRTGRRRRARGAAAPSWAGSGSACPRRSAASGYTLVEEALLFAELGAHATPGTVPADRAGRPSGRARRGDRRCATGILVGRAARRARRAPRRPRRHRRRHGHRHVPGHRPRRRRPGAGAGRRHGLDRRRVRPGRRADGVARPAGAHRGRHRVRRAGAVPPRRRLGPAAARDRAGRGRAGRHRHGDRRAVDRSTRRTASSSAQPVGAFQAVKHRCADMAVRAEAATSLVRYAALGRASTGSPTPRFHAHAARAVAAARGGRQRTDQRAEPRRHRLHLGAHGAPLRDPCPGARPPDRRRPFAPARSLLAQPSPAA